MKKKKVKIILQRALSVALSSAMLATSIPGMAFAEEVADPSSYDVSIPQEDTDIQGDILDEQEPETVDSQTDETEESSYIEEESTDEQSVSENTVPNPKDNLGDTVDPSEITLPEQIDLMPEENIQDPDVIWDNQYKLPEGYYSFEDLLKIDWEDVTEEDIQTIFTFTQDEDIYLFLSTIEQSEKDKITNLPFMQNTIWVTENRDTGDNLELSWADYLDYKYKDRGLQDFKSTDGKVYIVVGGKNVTISYTLSQTDVDNSAATITSWSATAVNNTYVKLTANTSYKKALKKDVGWFTNDHQNEIYVGGEFSFGMTVKANYVLTSGGGGGSSYHEWTTNASWDSTSYLADSAAASKIAAWSNDPLYFKVNLNCRGTNGNLFKSTGTGGSFDKPTSNLVFSKASYTVNYKPNGGSVSPTSRTVYPADGYGKDPTPTRGGYTIGFNANGGSGGGNRTGSYSFTGWTKDPTPTAHGGSMSATAGWKDNGTTAPANPTRTGYTFKGWFWNGQQVASGAALNAGYAGRTYVASWQANTYTITYNANKGTVSPTSQTVTYGAACPAAPTPTRTGYTFTGWSGGTYSGTYATAGNTTVTAGWKANTYTIAYNGNGSTSGSMSTTAATYDADATLLNNGFAKTGYKFQGWATSSTGAAAYNNQATVKNLTSTNGATVTLYAKWNPITYTVAFNSNGGSACSNITGKKYDETFTLPTSTRTGYTFLGWNGAGLSNKTGSVKNLTTNDGTTVSLTAQWQINNYAITYSGTSGATFSKSNPATYTIETDTFTLNNPTKVGYTFTGWTGSNGTTKQTNVSISKGSTGDKSYTANWDANKYTVKYDSKGGSACANTSATYGTSFTLPTPTRTGYTFLGWNGAGLSNKTGSTSNLTSTNNGEVTLTAGWQIIEYTITYNLAGGTAGNNNPSKYTVESADFTLQAPSKTGYQFTGWSGTGINGTSKSVSVTPGTTTGNYGNREYTANWQANKYTVKYDVKGGNAIDNTQAEYDKAFTLPVASKTGYTFLGWNGAGQTNKTGSVSNLTSENNGTVTLTANYAPITYTIAFHDEDGGNTFDNIAATYDQDAQLPKPTRKGFKFVGWNTSEDGNGENYSFGAHKNLTSVNGATVDLYAQWSDEPVIISFDTKGGSEVQNITGLYGSLSAPLPTTTKKGYIFGGWDQAGDVYEAGRTFVLDSDMAMEAIWAPIQYTITMSKDAVYPWTNTPVAVNEMPVLTLEYDQEGQVPEYFSQEIINIGTMNDYRFDGIKILGKTYKQGDTVVNLVDEKKALDAIPVWTYTRNNDTNVNPTPNPSPSPSPTPTPSHTYDNILAILANLQKMNELTAAQLAKISTYFANMYSFTDKQSQALIDLIKASGLSESEKIALLQALADGTLTESQKSVLLQLIKNSNMSDADKKALLAAINGISTLSLAEQKKILEALNNGSSADYTLNGITFVLKKNADGTISVGIKSLNGVKDVVIPDMITVAGKTYPVTSIADGAFKGNKQVESIKMPSSVTSIGNSAFEGCEKLKSITISDAVKTIGDNAFKNCKSLPKIEIPAAVTRIGNSAFEGCTKLQTIVIKDPSELLTIGKKAFYNTGMKSFTLPKSVIEIQSQAFAANKKLTSFKFKSDSKLVTLGTGVWEKDIALKKISLPKKLHKIPSKSFKGNKKMTSVKIPSAVTDIGASAFEGCVSMKTVTIPSKVMTIGKKAFYGDKKLKKVTIKSTILRKTGSKAFKKCKKNIVFKCPKAKLGSYKKILKGKY